MENDRIQQWFDEGKIRKALLGEESFRIPDNTYRDSHDRILVITQLMHWMEKNKSRINPIKFESLVLSLIEENFEESIDLLYSYFIFNKKIPISVDCKTIETNLKNQVNANGDLIVNSERIRNKVVSLSSYMPNIL
ncbi:hypothetical protein [Chengkuizengella sediminis]|uniref:hypothetical protein n=1 Tax=Chengkuizengella sediminis TaxID=1885917 RepID=UPI00138A6416|nr:hypothetical protein [Chengkuizengella sediminis]NDI35091.1 hypothetical protein [Chengkuizengella sediminis]